MMPGGKCKSASGRVRVTRPHEAIVRRMPMAGGALVLSADLYWIGRALFRMIEGRPER